MAPRETPITPSDTMRLNHLSLTHFRNFARLDFDLPAGTVLIVGGNAQGKTSILEAIYYLATLTSFHAHNDRQLINLLEGRKKLAVARIVAEYTKGERDHRLEIRIIKEQTSGEATARAKRSSSIGGRSAPVRSSGISTPCCSSPR
jgi:DNA replication and repair protein RecF